MITISQNDGELEDDAFLAQVDDWVLKRLQAGVAQFSDLLHALPGVYPSEVMASIGRLKREGLLEKERFSRMVREVASPPALPPRGSEEGNHYLEHPLDFEWRFTRSAVARLCEEIRWNTETEVKHILCLGCPSVYSVGQKMLPGVRFWLWDKNVAEYGQLEETDRLLALDLTGAEMPNANVDAVIIDPPWYLPFYRIFLWAAVAAIPLGGKIFASFPPVGTRTSATRDLAEVRAWAHMVGLVLERTESCQLPYRSPLFEVNALRTAGILCFPLNWRKGDLLVFQKQRAAFLARPKMNVPSPCWEEACLSGFRARICLADAAESDEVSPVGRSEVLPSVSSRNRLRAMANIVTSGNRFLKTANPAAFLEELLLMKKKSKDEPEAITPPLHSTTLRSKVLALVSREQEEAREYWRMVYAL